MSPPSRSQRLAEAVQQLTADITDQEVTDEAEMPTRWNPAMPADRRRERAINLIYAALGDAVLVAWVYRNGVYAKLTDIDWRGVSRWRDIILGGVIHAFPGEALFHHDGQEVWLDAAEFSAWRAKRQPEQIPAPPGPKPGEASPKNKACDLAVAILNDDALRPPRGKGRKIALAKTIKQRLRLSHQEATIAGYIGPAVDEWERDHPDK